eukprot:gene12730-12860_t
MAVQPSTAAHDAAGTRSADPCVSHDVPEGLLQWRHQQQGALEAAGMCLQQMAPGQYPAVQRPQQPGSTRQDGDCCPSAAAMAPGSPRTSRVDQLGRASRSSVLLREADSRPPGGFTGSLAGLWPLKPWSSRGLAGLRCAAAGHASAVAAGEGSDYDDQPPAADWLRDGQWPSEQLAWLLLSPPSQLVPIPLLVEQALLQPIQERVDLVGRQLLGSLMGEWCLLSQLQGLVGLFLMASPAVVEWCYSAFAAVEASAAVKRLQRPAANMFAAGAGSGPAGLSATGGLWGHSGEWAGLTCQHTGTWQLSLVYEPAELSKFSMVGEPPSGASGAVSRS